MKYPKATLRRNGRKMMTTTVKLNFGIFELVEVAIDLMRLQDEQDKQNFLPELTKAKLWQRAVETYTTSGINWFPEGPDVDDIRAEFEQAIIARISALFPELGK
jgi:hypothetical protein